LGDGGVKRWGRKKAARVKKEKTEKKAENNRGS
jgi:hypothetical protein